MLSPFSLPSNHPSTIDLQNRLTSRFSFPTATSVANIEDPMTTIADPRRTLWPSPTPKTTLNVFVTVPNSEYVVSGSLAPCTRIFNVEGCYVTDFDEAFVLCSSSYYCFAVSCTSSYPLGPGGKCVLLGADVRLITNSISKPYSYVKGLPYSLDGVVQGLHSGQRPSTGSSAGNGTNTPIYAYLALAAVAWLIISASVSSCVFCYSRWQRRKERLNTPRPVVLQAVMVQTVPMVSNINPSTRLEPSMMQIRSPPATATVIPNSRRFPRPTVLDPNLPYYEPAEVTESTMPRVLEPSEPTEELTAPTETTQAKGPTGPADSKEPIEPTILDEPTALAESNEPGQSTEPLQPVERAKSMESAMPAGRIECTEPVETAESKETAGPTEPTEPTENESLR
ncbi:hypothetical protein HDU97_004100 [Phlyctochytrium planicorne]|nr:hypothetical protein HDU97_004100 [Phlyctochytrium planicorne]